MAQAKGSNAQLIIQEETTFKTDPATPDCRKVHFVTEGIKANRAFQTTNIIRNNRNPAMPASGHIDVAGNIATHLQAFQFGTMLKGVLGSVVSTGTGPFVHTFKIGSSLPSFLIEKGFTDISQYFKYNGCKFNKMSFSVKHEGYQDVTFDIMGAKETVGTTPFDSTPTDLSYKPFNGLQIGSILEGGSAIANVVEVTGLTIENGIDGGVYVIGGAGERAALPEGAVKVSGTLKALFENLTLYNKAVNGTESSLKLTYQFGTGDGSAGNEYLEFLIPELKYTQVAPVVSGPQGIYVELPFEAYYENGTEASAIQVILKNTEATI